MSLAPQQPLLNPTSLPLTQPLLGFGTWKLAGNTSEVVSLAIQTGYRQIDCAAIYGNEKAVGEGIRDGLEKANLTRGDLWVTSKLWNGHHHDPEAALNQTLQDLGLEYLDLYLMHWPVGYTVDSGKKEFDHVKTWKAMLNLPKSKAHSLGISNFSPSQLHQIISATGVKPSVHQMELHPYLQQSSWVARHKALGISVTAYSPLGSGSPVHRDDESPPPLLQNPTLITIAQRLNCTPAQVALSWNMGRGASVIPKSSHEKYIKENFEAQEKCKLGYRDLVELRIMGRKFLTRFIDPSKAWGVKLFEGLDGV